MKFGWKLIVMWRSLFVFVKKKKKKNLVLDHKKEKWKVLSNLLYHKDQMWVKFYSFCSKVSYFVDSKMIS